MDSSWLFIGAVFLLAGFVKGVIGLGLPTIAIGLLGIVMAPVQAAALLVVPSMVTNVWQLASGPGIKMLLRRLWVMLLGFCIGAAIGGWLFGVEAHAIASRLLGAALVMYALVGLYGKRLEIDALMERRLAPWIGVSTGVVAVTTGVFVIPAVPYLQALKLSKDEMVQALGLSFTVSTIALGTVLTAGGVFKLSVAGASLLALAPALAGMLIGQAVRNLIRPDVFRTMFFAGLLALGAYLALR
ncbi:sulfite exporter TauE/SafE family protein [Noviherbaspirillum galbum]|uniref:Probable membrane transporter protein n=1 Tax=Noviherbaspirillum galbum TaxID=2709383 RepID=A0A6B3SJN8_9BURK|nr:sulfite exporter TauE/SafE family protein [Noviherbaspirillum galbum]NEX60940.1 sulfite exporter TauE/SafE family protein [Noviherbaspirillum galbum]